MVTVGMNYEVLAGKEKPFEKKFALVVEALDQTQGHIRTNLMKDVFNPRSYLVVSEWQERLSFEEFISSEVFRSVTKWGAETILATRPSHKVYGD
jgi:heme-degrading monooxygenase HmoA